MALSDYSIDTAGTQGDVNRRRLYAEALMKSAGDASPVRSPWQGVNRLAQGLLGGYQAGQADREETEGRKAANAQFSALFGGGAGPATVPGTASATPPSTPAPPAGSPRALSSPATKGGGITDYETLKDGTRVPIYGNADDPVPSPLDPPSGDDRQKMIATVVGESGNQPLIGQQAVASVIRNRAVDGGYGGNTPSAVVQAPNQFEPWNTEAGRKRMAAALINDPNAVAAADKAIALAYGEGGRAPEDPTEGKTMFYSPGAQAALGRPAPSWAKGEGQKIGDHVFYDDPDDTPAKPVKVASADSTGALPTGGSTAATAPVVSAPQPTRIAQNANVAAAMAVIQNPYATAAQKQVASAILSAGMKQDAFTSIGEGRIMNSRTGEVRKAYDPEEKTPTSVKEYKYYTDNFVGTPENPKPMPYDTWSTAKARAAATNITNNVDMNSGQTYDKQLAEGLGKAHASLANGVEDAQARARDIAAMQGAVDAIQRNGGTTGGMAPQARLEIMKSINAGAAAVGISKPFSEDDLSDKEFLTKFNRSMAGAQAKNAVGSRVTNFEMSNFLKANPGLDMTITGNQRLLGIQAQIEQRNIAVGNAIRDATAAAISQGKKIDPVTVEKIIRKYDEEHHIADPMTGQDLTQSYVLPEFQKTDQGTNAGLAGRHEQNMQKVRKYDPATGTLQ